MSSSYFESAADDDWNSFNDFGEEQQEQEQQSEQQSGFSADIDLPTFPTDSDPIQSDSSVSATTAAALHDWGYEPIETHTEQPAETEDMNASWGDDALPTPEHSDDPHTEADPVTDTFSHIASAVTQHSAADDWHTEQPLEEPSTDAWGSMDNIVTEHEPAQEQSEPAASDWHVDSVRAGDHEATPANSAWNDADLPMVEADAETQHATDATTEAVAETAATAEEAAAAEPTAEETVPLTSDTTDAHYHPATTDAFAHEHDTATSATNDAYTEQIAESNIDVTASEPVDATADAAPLSPAQADTTEALMNHNSHSDAPPTANPLITQDSLTAAAATSQSATITPPPHSPSAANSLLLTSIQSAYKRFSSGSLGMAEMGAILLQLESEYYAESAARAAAQHEQRKQQLAADAQKQADFVRAESKLIAIESKVRGLIQHNETLTQKLEAVLKSQPQAQSNSSDTPSKRKHVTADHADAALV